MRAITALKTFSCIAAISLSALVSAGALEVPEGELARVSFTRGVSFRAEFNNDSYSVFPGDDWDDFRTFGFFAGIAAREWALEITADSFTARGETTGDGTRVDEAYPIISRRIANLAAQGPGDLRADVECRIGIGALGTGDFGSAGIQDIVHDTYGCARVTPSQRDTPDPEWIGVANGVFLARLDDPRAPFFVATSLEASYSGFTRLRALAGLDWRSGTLGASVYGGVVGARGYDDLGGEAFSATLDSENGWYAGFTVTANPVEAGFSWNARENRQTGRVALVFGGPSGQADRSKGNRANASGKPLCADFRMLPLYAGIRLRQALFTGALTGSIAIGAEGGPMNSVSVRIGKNQHYRYEQAYLGFEIAKDLFGYAEIYALASGGIREETLKTAKAEEARLLERAVSPVFAGELGARLYPPLPWYGSSRWGLGVSGCAHLSDTLIPGWSPFFQLYLTGSAR